MTPKEITNWVSLASFCPRVPAPLDPRLRNARAHQPLPPRTRAADCGAGNLTKGNEENEGTATPLLFGQPNRLEGRPPMSKSSRHSFVTFCGNFSGAFQIFPHLFEQLRELSALGGAEPLNGKGGKPRDLFAQGLVHVGAFGGQAEADAAPIGFVILALQQALLTQALDQLRKLAFVLFLMRHQVPQSRAGMMREETQQLAFQVRQFVGTVLQNPILRRPKKVHDPMNQVKDLTGLFVDILNFHAIYS